MSKCHVQELRQVYIHLFEDVTYAYPTLGVEFERDLARLQRLVTQRGIRVFVVDMPNLGKHLDRCLSEGEYKLSGLPLSRRFSNRVVIPKFLRGLYLLVFNESGSLKEDYDVQAIFFLRQILFAAKKASLHCGDEAVLAEVQEFLATDLCLPEPERVWEATHVTNDELARQYTGFQYSERYLSKLGHDLYCGNADEMLVFLRNLDTVSGLLTASLGPYRFRDWRFKHGPGAISEVTGPTNKFCWRNWSDRLESVFPIADCGFHNYAAWAGNVERMNISSNEPMSRLVDVPKTFTKPRLIAAEPSEHQWCQQNIWHYFGDRVRKTWVGRFIRFTDQRLNQELCSRGSEDGSLATVDLSAASDRVTCHVVGQAFRRSLGLLQALRATRTRLLGQTLDENSPSVTQLKKFSTMGSACTFPVESLVFLSIVLASVLTTRKQKATIENIERLEGDVAVFGDDLVIPTDSRGLLFEALEVLDFKVNSDKSFWTGKFRESCGVDSFAGVTVTPAYWKQPLSKAPESVASTVDVCNNFHDKWLLSTSSYLASTLQKRFSFPSVAMDSGVSGIKFFVRPVDNGVKTRVNEGLQRMESLVPVLSCRVRKTPITDDSSLLQYFTERPSPYVMWRGGVPKRAVFRMRYSWVPTVDLGSHS